MSEDVKEAIRARYPQVHPLIFSRSAERAKTNGELFDILETLPDEFPIVWDDILRAWVVPKDMFHIEPKVGDEAV